MIAFFARNGVAANLLMFAIIFAGGAALLRKSIPLEVFPEFESDTIMVSVPYRGATPEEVEESIVIRVEEAIADIEGIEQIYSTASESGGTVSIEVDEDYDRREVLDEVESRIASIPGEFPPGDAEKVSVSLADWNRWVISVVLFAEMDERDLRKLGEQIRDEITNLSEVSGAELQGIRPYEITIEIDEAALQRFGLTFEQISGALRASSIDVPAGTMRTEAGEVSLRTRGRAYTKEAFERITLMTTQDGQRLTVADVARVTDGFDENPFLARFNGKRCVVIAVFREGNQSAIRIADQVKEYMAEAGERLERYNVGIDFWSDSSKIVRGRLETLLDSAWKSMLFVFILLTLFLRPSLALWVVIGIPICFLGTFAVMPFLGVSINIVSLFAFILVLGVVVDDAIVTGENIYIWQRRGVDRKTASVEGTREVALPVVFGILTTILAFGTMFIGSGHHGQWQSQIATIVIVVLVFSLVESKLILPAHLSHDGSTTRRLARSLLGRPLMGVFSWIWSYLSPIQEWFSNQLENFVRKVYQPTLDAALKWRYLTAALFLGILVLSIGWIAGGRMLLQPFPRVESDRVTCRLTMQEGTPFEETEKHIYRIEETIEDLREKYRTADGESVVENVMSTIGGQGVSSSRRRGSTGLGHLGEVEFYLMPREERNARGIEFDNMELVKGWREAIGEIVGAQELTFRAELFRSRDPIDVQLTGKDVDQLTKAAAEVRKKLAIYEGLFDINDSLDDARDEIQLRIKPEAEQFGLNMSNLARQVRQAFFGEEIQRIIRGRDEVRVMLRYPEADRRSVAALERMRIRTPEGQEVPFTSVAEVTVATSFPRIQRIDRNRAVNVRADADKDTADLDSIRENLSEFLGSLILDYPGVNYSFEGEARDEREANAAKWIGLAIIGFGIYAMLAIPFQSYVQPLMVMLVIPFGLIGAVIGHWIEGEPLSMLSQFGMLALSGVVVNDSLVLVDFINRRVRGGVRIHDAVHTAGAARFRPILLTSITTFAGLYPLLTLESTQAQVLIPMAISLGYGILFATFITLFLVPVSYLILEDIKALMGFQPRHLESSDSDADDGDSSDRSPEKAPPLPSGA